MKKLYQPFEIRKIAQQLLNTNKNIEIEENYIGRSDASVYILIFEKRKYVLKAQQVKEQKSLHKLKNILLKLQTKLPVNKVIKYVQTQNQEFLLTDYIEGEPIFLYGEKKDGKNVGIILGKTLKMIHNTDFSDFEVNNEFENRIAKVKKLILENEFRPAIIKETFGDKSTLEIIDYINSLIPQKWDLVLTHGDFCLPNILIKNNKLSGIIDLIDCRICDRAYDIYYALWSLNYNKMNRFKEDFLVSYSIDKIPSKTIKLIGIIDWLWYDYQKDLISEDFLMECK